MHWLAFHLHKCDVIQVSRDQLVTPTNQLKRYITLFIHINTNKYFWHMNYHIGVLQC